MMRWPPIHSLESLWGLRLNTRALLVAALLLSQQQQGQPEVLVEGVEAYTTSFPVDGTLQEAAKAAYVHQDEGAPLNGDSRVPDNEQDLSPRGYDNERELYWNSGRPQVGWRRSVGGIATVASAVAAVLGVVFLLLSCGVSISRGSKATHSWGGRRRLSSRGDERLCEQAIPAAEGGADREGAAAGDGTGRGPDVGNRTTEGGLRDSAVPSLEGAASPESAEAAAEGAAAGAAAGGAAGAAAGATAAGAGEATEVATEAPETAWRPSLLWEGNPGKAVGHSPFLGSYMTRLREFLDFCRVNLSFLPTEDAYALAGQVVLYSAVEIAAVWPLCASEERRQADGTIRAIFRLCSSFGYSNKNPWGTSPVERVLFALNLLRHSRIPVPLVETPRRAQKIQAYLPAAGAALRHFATAVNSVMQSLRGRRAPVPPDVAAMQAVIISAVINERLLQALADEASAEMLMRFQERCLAGDIFSQQHLTRSATKYRQDSGNPLFFLIDEAVMRAQNRFIAEQRIRNSVPQQTETPEAAAGRAADCQTVPDSTASSGLERQRVEQLLQRGGQQPLELQTVPAVPAAGMMHPVGPESPQEAAPARGAEAGAAGAVADREREEGSEPYTLNAPVIQHPPTPIIFLPGYPMAYTGALSHLPPHQVLLPTPAGSIVYIQTPPQVGQQQQVRYVWPVLQQQQQGGPGGPWPQHEQQMWLRGPPPPQQQHYGIGWGIHYHQPHNLPIPVPSQQQLRLGQPLGPFAPPQQQEQPWGSSHQQHEQPDLWMPSTQHQEPREPLGPFAQPEQQEQPRGSSLQQQEQQDPWMPPPQNQEPRGPLGPFAQPEQQAQPWGSSLQQQEQRDLWMPLPPQQDPRRHVGPFPQLAEQDEPWRTSSQQRDRGDPWMPLLSQQLPQETWVHSPPQQKPQSWMYLPRPLGQGEEDPSRASSGPFRPNADDAFLLTPERSPAEVALPQQAAGIGRYNADSAGKAGLQQGVGFATTTASLERKETAARYGYVPQQKPEHRPGEAFGLFRGTDYTAPLTSQVETREPHAHLPQQQQQQLPPQRLSGAVSRLGSIAGTSREGVSGEAYLPWPPFLQPNSASSGETPPTVPRSLAGGYARAEDVRSGAEPKPKSPSKENQGRLGRSWHK